MFIDAKMENNISVIKIPAIEIAIAFFHIPFDK